MKGSIKHILTLADNQTYDAGRVLWAIGTLAYIGFTWYALLHDWKWDAQDWAIGFGAIMTGGGAALWAKKDTEPTNADRSGAADKESR